MQESGFQSYTAKLNDLNVSEVNAADIVLSEPAEIEARKGEEAVMGIRGNTASRNNAMKRDAM